MSPNPSNPSLLQNTRIGTGLGWQWLQKNEGKWWFAFASAICFLVSCQVSASLVFQQHSITSYWPGSGLYIFLLAYTKPKSWLKIVPCLFVANLIFNLASKGANTPASFGFALSNIVEALFARYLLMRDPKRVPQLATVDQFLRFIRDWVVLAPIAGAVIGASIVWITFSGVSFATVFGIWWMSDALGTLTIVPLLFAFANTTKSTLPATSLSKAPEFCALLLTYSIGAFYFLGSGEGWHLQPSVFVIPIFFWAFLRFGNTTLLFFQLLLTYTVLYFAARDLGPFAHGSSTGIQTLFSCHIYLFVMICSFMIFSCIQQEGTALLMFTKEVTDHIGTGLAVMDHDKTIVWSNRRAIQTLNGGALDQIKENPEAFFKSSSENSEYQFKTQHLGRPDQWHLASRNKIIHSPFGNETTLLAFHNITAIKDTEAELINEIEMHKSTLQDLDKSRMDALQASRAKSEFLSRMSHEIRNPLNSILGLNQLLRLTELNDEQKKYLNTFANATENLIALVNDLLDLSKIEMGKIEIDCIEYQPFELLTSSVELMHNTGQKQGLRIHAQLFPGSNVLAKGDPLRVRQILLNLISNAVKFTEKGDIVVGLRKVDSKEELCFFVRDTGIGMTATQQAMLFRPYQQITDDPQLKQQGTGLGLHISRGLAEAMQGRIEVLSVPGAGSTFSLFIPFIPSVRQSQLQSENFGKDGHTAKQTVTAPLKILVVDDRPENRLLLRFYLEKLNHEIDEADDGDTAVLSCARQKYDLVLMDLNMPRLCGEDAFKEIKKLGTLKSIPICVAVSANASLEDIARSRDVGFHDHMIKPVSLANLKQLIERIANETSPNFCSISDGSRFELGNSI